MNLRRQIKFLLAALFVGATSACSSIDDERIPPTNVNVIFSTIGEWELYGVSGAGSARRFIYSERVPAGFPYKGIEGTGYGGLLLIADPLGECHVYDLACPVCSPTISRIVADTESDIAGIYRCNKCGSAYDVFAYGTPHSGKAATSKFGLRRYNIRIIGSSPYAIISY